MIRARILPFSQFRSRWRELLRDPGRPHRTAAAFALGTWIGTTPLLGVHTWAAVGSATVLRLPPLAVVLGSNISNPITFLPLCLIELRVGCWLLGRPFRVLPTEFRVSDLSQYLAELWAGWALFGVFVAAISYVAVERALALRRAYR